MLFRSVRWSPFFVSSSESKKLFSSKGRGKTRGSGRSRKQKLELDLHPEGYCRIREVTTNQISCNANSNKTKLKQSKIGFKNARNNSSCRNSSDNSLVLGIGRWKRRPWGVTIVVRPLSPISSQVAVEKSASVFNNPYVDSSKEVTTTTKKNILVVDEDTQFIFHASNFHWNGFGTNPKLTQGTILLEKQKKANARNNMNCWWKSSTSSSILPVWPEEMLPEDNDMNNSSNEPDSNYLRPNYLRPLSMVKRLVSMNSQIKHRNTSWFRPIVGTFSARGMQK